MRMIPKMEPLFGQDHRKAKVEAMAEFDPKRAGRRRRATASHTGIAGRIRNYFLTGLVVAGPLAVTVWLIWSFINWVDDLVRPFIPPAYRPETYLPWPIPGTGLVIAFIALTLLGFLTANLVGRTLVELGESLLNRMPIVRPIYKTMKQIFETLFSKTGSSFRKVALVEFPAPGMWSLVFLSQPPSGEIAAQAAARRACLGVPALHAQPDHRLLLLRQRKDLRRARHLGGERDDAADLRRHGAARRASAQKKLAALAATARAAQARARPRRE